MRVSVEFLLVETTYCYQTSILSLNNRVVGNIIIWSRGEMVGIRWWCRLEFLCIDFFMEAGRVLIYLLVGVVSTWSITSVELTTSLGAEIYLVVCFFN